MDKNWIIEQTDFSGSATTGLMESLFTMGNGYLGLRGDFPLCEHTIEKGTYINGFYESGPITYGEKAYGYADSWQTIVPLPESKEIAIEVDGNSLFHDNGHFASQKRTLDLEGSKTEWSFAWRDEKKREYKGTVFIIIPFEGKGIVRYEWRLSLPEEVNSIRVSSSLIREHKESSHSDDPRLPGHFDGTTLTTEVIQSYSQQPLLLLRTGGSCLTSVSAMTNKVTGIESHNKNIEPVDGGFREVIYGSSPGEIIITKTVAYRYGESKSEQETIKELLSELSKFSKLKTDLMIQNQKAYMDRFWQKSDVIIEGDEEAQLSLRFNLFQLLQSTGRDNSRSIAAKGLSGSGYEGHYFWDAETYILPFFIYTNPEIARSMLMYRISKIDSAEKRAGKLSHKGILFPWRTINGEECSAYFPAGTAQFHINSDIALGLAKYLEVTGDTSILDEGGDRLLSETARFWSDFGFSVPGKGFCLNSVTGPDEYTALVNNNYFTNLSVRENLKAAAHWLKGRISGGETAQWKDLADQVYLPPLGTVTPQDDSFLQKEPWDFEGTDESSYPLLLHFHPLNIYRKQVLKQADVIMAQALFPSELPEEQMKLNFDYYEQLTTRDSSLSACAQGISAFRLSYDELAWEYFNETLHTDRKDLHGNVSHGLHTASMGGSYLMIVNGFLRLDNRKGVLSLSPAIPSQIQRLALNLQIGEGMLKVDIKGNSLEYTSADGSIRIFHYGEEVNLEEGQSVSFVLPERFSRDFTLFRPRT